MIIRSLRRAPPLCPPPRPLTPPTKEPRLAPEPLVAGNARGKVRVVGKGEHANLQGGPLAGRYLCAVQVRPLGLPQGVQGAA